MDPKPGKDEWQVACEIATAMGYPMHYDEAAQIMDEIARVTPTFAGVSFAHLDRVGSVQWPCNEAAPEGTPIMHVDGFVRGLGHFEATPYVPTDEKANRKFPLLLTTGRILSQYNVGAQTRRTANVEWHHEDVLELHEADAEERGIKDADWVALSSRAGETHMRARISDRVPQGVVYTTFHFPESGANVVTTEYSDWATNCPEYKVTAVQIRPANADEPAWDTSGPAHDMALDDLVRMADQIAANQAYRAAEEAVSIVANHIKLFWAPAMQRDLLAALASGEVELSPVARRAMEQLQPA
jgi:formate dehydrogenase major subunit